MRFFLVRHADAGDREAWRGDDRGRPLNDRGQAQASGLVEALRHEEIGRLLTSPFVRCIQTLEPLAAARGLTIEPEAVLAEGSDWRETVRLMAGLTAPTAMCSQGDVIGDLVGSLVERGLVRASDARWKKGSTWVLDVEKGRITGATYLPPAA